MAGSRERAWWRSAVIYQVFPLSFQDSDGDGFGDLPGLLARLDHIGWLSPDAVWLSPVQPSPLRDAGYDVSEFTAIDRRFGSMADFDRLLAELHARRIRLITDFVPNHTSNEHAWFKESRASKASAKRDWYIWADGRDGGPPNNWLSRFGGSAWTFDEASGQYFYHAFLEEQPDLNWHNEEVRAALAEAMRFWLRKGVDGFRVDASGVLVHDDLLRDDPPNEDAGDETPPAEKLKRVFTDSRPEALSCLAQLRRVIDEFDGRFFAGEADTASERAAKFYGDEREPRLHAPLNFRLLDTPFDVLSLQGAIDEYLNVLPPGACPTWALGGHDKKRLASRVGQEAARVAAMLHFTLPGTVFFYAGDEIGMSQVEIPPERIVDPFEKLSPGYGLNRDPERTPMRWKAGPKTGFTTGEPWLPVGENSLPDVAACRADRSSILWFYGR